MFITGVFIPIWLILFDKSNVFLFSLLITFMFCIDFIFILTYLSLISHDNQTNRLNQCPFKFLWSHITNDLLIQRNHSQSNIFLQNRFRRLMFLRIQNLLQSELSNQINSTNQYTFFNYHCPVCFNNKQCSMYWIALGCGHILCSLCTQQIYFSKKSSCPTCREPIVLSDLTILYI